MRAQILTSLDRCSDEDLTRVTRDAGLFGDGRWLRLLDRSDVSRMVRGRVEMSFAAIFEGESLLAIAPFFVTRSRSIHNYYSIEKFFFGPRWASTFERDPSLRDWARRARRLGEREGAWPGAVVAVSPLSHRWEIAVDGHSPRQLAHAARVELLGCLQQVASDQGLPLLCVGIPEDSHDLRGALLASGFEELFLTYDTLLELGGGSFDAWLGGFPGHRRRRFRADIRRVARAGFVLGDGASLEDRAGRLSELYEATASRHGAEHFVQPPEFWQSAARLLGDMARPIYATRHGELEGFSLSLVKGDTMTVWRVGRSRAVIDAREPVYFALVYYDPVRLALERGLRRVFFGKGYWSLKVRHGAVPHPLYAYLWFPRPWGREALPYYRAIGALHRRRLDEEVGPVPAPVSAGSPAAPCRHP